MTPTPPVVLVEDVSHRFATFQALRGLSLRIERGDIYGLLGLNGAGKTTTLRLLLGFIAQQSGRLELFGRDRRSGWLDVCDRIGATVESPAFYPHLTGEQNLNLLRGLSPGRDCRPAREALELTGIARAAHIRVGKYSMGMLQRLYIAQALLTRPELLILDEPTSNLDPLGILELRRLLRRLNQEEGLTILFSSHQLSEVEDLCNRVAIIHGGRRILESAVSELFSVEQCEIEIETAERHVEGALELLNGTGWCLAPARAGERGLKTRIPRERRGELNALLVGRGFEVAEFRERRPTLEDFFHQSIAGGEETDAA